MASFEWSHGFDGWEVPPPKDWDAFQDFCADLFGLEFEDPSTERYGRRGQSQRGVDVYCGQAKGGPIGIQCKGKRRWPPRRVTAAEVRSDVNKALGFTPPLAKFLVATTALTDSRMQDLAREITERHARDGLFSVQIIGWDELVRRATNYPSLSSRCFAAFLRAVPSWDAAQTPETIRTWQSAAIELYTERSSGLVETECREGGEVFAVSTLGARVVASRKTALVGPSGLGKSMLANRLAADWLRGGGVALTLEARDFEGDFRVLLAREVRLASGQEISAIEAAFRDSGLSTLLIIDGANECTPLKRSALMREAEAWAGSFEGQLLVVQHDGANLSNYRVVEMVPPSLQAKLLIAGLSPTEELDPRMTELLSAVGTGLEAAVIGSLSESLPAETSRYFLIDAFFRARLGEHATKGLEFLIQVAGLLRSRMAFSLAERDVERATRGATPDSVRQAVFQSGLLHRRGQRISFAHETFFEAMTADWIIDRARSDPTRTAEMLAEPLYRSSAPLVVGALAGDPGLPELLEAMTDESLLAECLAGACGPEAYALITERSKAALRHALEEATSFNAERGTGIWGIAVRANTNACSPQQIALMKALARCLDQGDWLHRVLEVVRATDLRIAAVCGDLSQGLPAESQSPRDALFASAYVLERPLAISHLMSSVHSDFRFGRESEPALALLTAGERTPGELYLLLLLLRWSKNPDSVARHLPSFLHRYWERGAYHVQLELAYAAREAARANEVHRQALLATLENLPPSLNLGVASSVTEAVAALGGLGDVASEQKPLIEAELAAASVLPDRLDQQSLVYRSFCNQFDHPLDFVYSEVWQGLEGEHRKKLLRMAAAASAADGYSYGADVLIKDLAKFGVRDCRSELWQWTAVPAYDHLDALDTFAMAYVALGRLGLDLPERSSEMDSAGRALGACGEVLYWTNRTDISESIRSGQLALLWEELARAHPSSSADALARIEPKLHFPGTEPYARSIRAAHPFNVLEICREALPNLEAQRTWFQYMGAHAEESRNRFVFSVLEELGGAQDVPALQRWIGHPGWGPLAIRAIQAIDDRRTVGS